MKLKNPSLDQVIHNPITVFQNTTLLDAREVLLKHKIGRLVVIGNNKKPVGLVTEKDFVRVIYELENKPLEKVLIKDVMSKNPISVKRKNTIYDCARLMKKNKISSVLILEDNGTLAGIVTKTDLASVFLTQSAGPLLVSNVMTRKVISVMPADSLLLVESLLLRYRISRVVVERNKRPVGIITNRDFLPAKMPKWLREFADPKEVEKFRFNPSPNEFKMNRLSYILSFRAEDIMTPNPITVEDHQDVSKAVLLMIRNGISGLPVTKKSYLAGIITKSDVVSAIAEG